MSTHNLYDLPIDGAQVKSYCGGNLTGDNESCVGVAKIPGADGFAITDTKPEGAGRSELRFTTEELDNFAVGWIAQRHLAA